MNRRKKKVDIVQGVYTHMCVICSTYAIWKKEEIETSEEENGVKYFVFLWYK